MGDLPEPRFRIGDTVFHPYTVRQTVDIPCPDCLGTKYWQIRTPAGEEFKCNCQRCSAGHWRIKVRGVELPALVRVTYTAFTRRLTIGSVRVDTASVGRDECPVTYMCRETGVGSGNVYAENKLFESETDAQAAADVEAASRIAAASAEPEAIHAAYVGGLVFETAARAASWSTVYDAWAKANRYRDFIDQLIENGRLSKDEKEDAGFLFSDNSRAPAQPFEKLVAAARECGNAAVLDALKELDAMLSESGKR